MNDTNNKNIENASEERRPEEVLAEADIKIWRNFTKGTLLVWPTSVGIYAKPSFWKSRSLQAEFSNDTINSFKLDGDPAQVLLLNIIGQDVYKDESIIINDAASAQQILLTLRKTLGPLDEKSRVERKKEEEEQQRRAIEQKRQQLNESYIQYVWSSAGALHMVINSVYIIITALSRGNWETAKGQFASLWRETDILQEHDGFAMTASLQKLREAFDAADGPYITTCCAVYVERLFDQCLKEKQTDYKWDDNLMEKSLRPSRFQLTYWLLFEILYREMILDGGIEDWLLVNQCISKMRSLIPVLDDSFGVKTADCMAQLAEASEKRDSSLLIRHSGELEIRLGASSSSRWCREVK
jgi:hypothetical protein